jgi:hypothetical protein
MTWHYRVLRHADGSLALHEVYCDASGRPNACTERPISFAVDGEEGLEALVQSLRLALDDATNRPVLDISEIATVSTSDAETRVPNEETIAAIEDVRRGNLKPFSSVAALMAELNADDPAK